jgi:transglutaminase-like putative cysteine protease
MYDIRQFKPALYILLFLGIGGFALAAESPGALVLGWTAMLFNAWLVTTGQFRPIPRWTSNLILLAGVPWVLMQSRGGTMNDEVVWIGQYIVLLQIVKLYEQRGNRDYAQLLVLGLLLMVAAAINTASLAFGLLLLIYLFLSLYCCLLFYLKTEADSAKRLLAIPEEKNYSATLRQDQRYLARSMRHITGFIAVVAIFFAVIVFLFFPRINGDGIFGIRQIAPEQPLTGFTTDVSFQQVARISQSNTIVAHVKVWKNDRPVKGTEPLVLRGVTLERYRGDSPESLGRQWDWEHVRSYDDGYAISDNGVTQLRDNPPTGTDLWRQNVSLLPTGTNVLFAIAGPISITTHRPTRIDFSPATGTLRSPAALLEPLNYEVISSNNLDPPPDAEITLPDTGQPDPQILAFASRPEVCGSNARGSLASQRASLPGNVDPLDAQIASNIEKYLRENFTYTLDLTDVKRIEGRDPLVAFLYDFKRGHCEYFAGAMTLMCQSVGMQARMVLGFKSDEYNEVSGQYIVRQSDAHSWVEVRTADGWRSYDPTSGTPADLAARPKGGLWQSIKHVEDYFESTYAEKIIAYDNEDRQNLVQAAETAMYRATSTSRGWFDEAGGMAESVRFWKISSTVLGAIVWLMVAALLVAFAGFFLEKWRLRRRAARIGIDALPMAEQQRLARQLAFYDHLILMLGRHQLVRPNCLTPLEFVESLLFLPSDVYDTINRLTKLFYRVRFGGAELSIGQRRRLETVLGQLSISLAQTPIAKR